MIDPPDGNIIQYFDSLHRLLALPKLSSLFPAHGPAIGYAQETRRVRQASHHAREQNTCRSRRGASLPHEIVEAAYTDVNPAMYGLAERSTMAHLEKLEEEGRVIRSNGGYRASPA